MNEIGIFNETDYKLPEIDEAEAFINFAVSYLKLDHVIFTIVFVDNERIHEINREYRHVDRPTDVISFALEDGDDFVHPECRILGDIYLSVPKAIEQAKEYGHSLRREIQFLLTHGLLHLLGYDHMEKEEERVMFQLQEAIIDAYRKNHD